MLEEQAKRSIQLVREQIDKLKQLSRPKKSERELLELAEDQVKDIQHDKVEISFKIGNPFSSRKAYLKFKSKKLMHKAVVVLKCSGQFSYQEIADLLGIDDRHAAKYIFDKMVDDV